MKNEEKKKEKRPSKQGESETGYTLRLDEAQQQIKFLNTILDSIPHAIYVIDANDFTIKLANQPARRGSLPENATCYSFIHNNSKPCADYVCPLEQVKKSKTPVIVERTYYDEAGKPKNIEVQAFPVFNSEGNVVQMIECCMDITGRKRAEEGQRISEEKFSKAFHLNPSASAISTMNDGKFVDVNEAFCLIWIYA